ncbi:hypothetical protein ACFLRT_01490 [Acidobacteriota bacterium]
MKNIWATRHKCRSQNVRGFCPIDLSGEFLPGGSYLPGFIAKFLYLMMIYCKKNFFLEREKNSPEHLILQGYLISNIQPDQEKNKYFPEIPVIGTEVALGI